MENGVDMLSQNGVDMLSQNDIEIVVENEVENDQLPASGDLRERPMKSMSQRAKNSGDSNEQTDKTHPLENTLEEANSTNTQYELIDITNSITGEFNKLNLTASALFPCF